VYDDFFKWLYLLYLFQIYSYDDCNDFIKKLSGKEITLEIQRSKVYNFGEYIFML